jgi:outer membrane receptor protein involved in Fe transport
MKNKYETTGRIACIIFAIFLTIVWMAIPCFAQSAVGGASLNGTITDASGAVVPNAKVTATNPATGLTRATQTSDVGLYNFAGLPVGNYDLSVAAQGFKAAKRTGVPLQIGAVATVDVRLEVGNMQETVSVSAEAPVVETTRSSAASNVTEKAVGNLPVNGRNFIDFTLLTPGVVRDVRGTGDLSFAGQRGTMNSLLVDGGDSNNLFFGQATGRTGFRPYAFSEDAVQEFQVNTAGYLAEVGRAGGGAINMVTKSGTNAFHGSAFEYYRDKSLNANTSVNNSLGRPKGAYHFNQFGGTLGGPIKKDKLFFFFSYDGQRNVANQVLAPNIYPTGAALAALQQYLQPYIIGLKNNVYLGKVDWNIGPNDRLSVRYNSSRYTGINQENPGPTSALQHTGNNQVNTDNVAVSYTKVIGSKWVYDAHFNYVRDMEPGLANTNGPEVSIINGIIFGKNNFSPRYTNTHAYQPLNTLSYVTGRHSFKFGADINIVKADNYFPGFFAGGYVFPSYAAFLAGQPTSYQQGFSSSGTVAPISHPDVNEYAFFAQDTWRVNEHLTLNLGFRYDFFDYRQPTTLNSNAGLAAANLLTNRIATDKGNVGPRFGLAYKPFNDDKTVIRGGYGMYYARTPGLLLSTAILQNAIDVLTYQLTSNLPVYPNILTAPPSGGLAPPSIDVVAPNFKTELVQQWNFQVERKLGTNYALTAGYLGVHGTHLTRSRDINLYPAVLTQGTLSTGGTIYYYRHPGTSGPARPNPAFGRITLFDSGADSEYDGGFIQLTKRFSQNLQMLMSYTFSKAIDSAPDATSVVVGNAGDDAKVAQDTLQPNLERGLSVNNIRHRFVLSAVWDLNYAKSMSNSAARALLSGWTVSTIFQAQSGQPVSMGATGDPENDGNNYNDRVPLVGRDTLTGPGLGSLDLRLTREIPIKERVRLRLIFEGFDITNHANWATIQNNMYTFKSGVFTPTTNYQTNLTMQPQGVGARVFQLAAKIIF